jgi:uncharacterized protein (DUF1330 family)
MAYLAPTQELGRRFVMRGLTGNVVMLNLIRLRTVADYSGFPDLAPESPVSGRAAYDLYIEHTLPYLQKSGGRLDFLAEGGSWLIGPEDERWDLALLVRQKDMETFFGFEQDPDYMKILGHRTAAVEDSTTSAARRTACVFELGIEPPGLPGIALARKPQPVVRTESLVLPELDLDRRQAEAAPGISGAECPGYRHRFRTTRQCAVRKRSGRATGATGRTRWR